MSTIYVFHQECPAIASAASGDVLLVYDTSLGRTTRATFAQVQTLLASISQASLTTTATGATTTLNSRAGVITTEAITSVLQTQTYTLTVTNTFVTGTDICMASIANGTNTQGVPFLSRVTPGAGTIAFVLGNAITSPVSGTMKISFITFAA
jgi:hypothetical protein